MSEQSPPDLISRTAVGIAAGLAALLVIGVIVIGKLLGSGTAPSAGPTSTTAAPRTGPLVLVPVDAPQAGSAACTSLLGVLPAELTSGPTVLRRLPLAAPAPPSTVAWGDVSSEPVVLRCGLARPPELTPTAQLREISGIKWLPVDGARATTWYLVDRAVYAALTVPAGTGTGVLQGVSEAISEAIASVR